MTDLSRPETVNPLDVQVGGDHYKGLPVQPMVHMEQNGIAQCLPSINKYVMRFQSRGGARDLRKSMHYLDSWLQLDSEGLAAAKGLIPIEVVLEMCRLNSLSADQTRVLVATQTDQYGPVWPDVARTSLERLLLVNYGAEAGD